MDAIVECSAESRSMLFISHNHGPRSVCSLSGDRSVSAELQLDSTCNVMDEQDIIGVSGEIENQTMQTQEYTLRSMSRNVDNKTLPISIPRKGEKKENLYEYSYRLLFTCALGILVCFFFYGIIQESITKGKYGDGDKAEKFTYTISLVFLQCVINTVFAWIVLNFNRENDTTPQKYYAACSLSYLGAMVSSNHALQHVSYPTQVLGKSAKPIPVMILGILLAKKRYPAAKFLFILMIVIGVALFMYKDKPATVTDADSSLFGIGEVLLLVSLTLDGLTGASQDKMRAEHKTGGYSMMVCVNLWSLLWLAIGLLLTGELWTFPGFVQRYPSVLIKIVTFGIASALGQMFIFLSVANFGPLTCSIITTTRKFFTILGSVIIFQNPMSGKQWIGTMFVFAGLSLDSAYGKEKKNR